MHSKRSLIRVLTRVLYGGGLLLLVAGLLLSAISSPALAAGLAALNPAATLSPGQTTLTPDCGCGTVTPTVVSNSQTPVPRGASSLVFTSGCNCSCKDVSATVCNVGTGDMKTAVNWDLYYSVDSNPAVGGTRIQSGTLGPLKAG